MPYPQLEELTSRKREKVALFFTAEHMAGMLALGLPAYLGTLGTTFGLRLLILLAAAVLGVLITSDMGGMAGYERVLWWVRGRLRRRLLGTTLRPDEFTVTPVAQIDRAVPLGGPIRRARGRGAAARDPAPSVGLARAVVAPRARGTGRTAVASNGHGMPSDAAAVVADGARHGQ